MDVTSSRPLAKRSRVALACNTCRQTKSKCDSERPCCGRCAQHNIDCVYTPRSLRDKRLGRHEERRARLAHIAAMPDLTDASGIGATSKQRLSPTTSANLQPRPVVPDGNSPPLATLRQETPPDDSFGAVNAGDTTYEMTDNTDATDAAGTSLDAETDAATRMDPVDDTDATSAIDMLATAAFDDEDSQPTTDIGFFGLSSNVALYRSVTQALSYVGTGATGAVDDEGTGRVHDTTQPLAQEQHPLTSLRKPGNKHQKTSSQMPSHSRILHPSPLLAIRWITRFFDSVGAVLPYIMESALLREVNMVNTKYGEKAQPRRSTQALLSIIFAYAISVESQQRRDSGGSYDDCSTGDESAYYRQALQLTLAEEQQCSSSGGGGATIETVQALLLLGSYQQNSQRAMASLTSHALCVKTSYQLGLHCRGIPGIGVGLSEAEKAIRATLWCAVVNQDRVLSAALGRPCMIPINHIHAQHVSHPGIPPFFRNLSSLHSIMGDAIDAVHGSNLGLPPDFTPGELVSKTVEILSRLALWQDTVPLVPSSDNTLSASVSTDDSHVHFHRVILSLNYHRTVMLACGPVLMAVLLRNTEHRPSASSSKFGIVQEASASILKTDLISLRGFQRIMADILKDCHSSSSSFLKQNASWWTCNFTALTMCLHTFALWLVTLVSPPMGNIIGVTNTDMETLLLQALATLRAFGGSSVMSFKAHRCLLQHVKRVRWLAAQNVAARERRPSLANSATNVGFLSRAMEQPQDMNASNMGSFSGLHGNGFPIQGFPEFTAPTLDDLLCQLGDNDFMSPNSSNMGMEMNLGLGNMDMGSMDLGGLSLRMDAGTEIGMDTGISRDPFLFN